MKLLDNNGLAYFWSKVRQLLEGLQTQVDSFQYEVSDNFMLVQSQIDDLKNNQGGDITDIDGGGP